MSFSFSNVLDWWFLRLIKAGTLHVRASIILVEWRVLGLLVEFVLEIFEPIVGVRRAIEFLQELVFDGLSEINIYKAFI